MWALERTPHLPPITVRKALFVITGAHQRPSIDGQFSCLPLSICVFVPLPLPNRSQA